MDPFANKQPTKEQSFLLKAGSLFGIKRASWDKLKKSLENPDNESALKVFFNANDIQGFIFVLMAGADSLQLLTEFPKQAQFKKKVILVVKARRGVAIEKNNMKNELVFMDFNKQIIDNLSVVAEQAYMPVLNNPLNQQGWSDLVSKDLLDKLHFFLSNVAVTLGQIKGRTMLPLPPTDITSSERTSSKDKAHILETAIITWTKQIKSVLKQDPEGALKAGNDPDPLTELDFWKNKAENLNSIHSQLQSERVKRVLKFLDQNKSAYTPPFSKLQKEVQAARTQANDNCRYLQQLNGLFISLTQESKDFMELPELFQPIMHIILLIWTHSHHYNTPSRLVVLIREICNAIIRQACRFINGEMIFNLISEEDPGEAHNKLTMALDVSAKFKEAYFEYKAKANNTWNITTNALFIRLDAFMERCQDIMHFTQTIVQFNKLSKIDIGGTKGSELTATIGNIFSEFQGTVEKFKEVSYDIMDIAIRSFDDDFYAFRQRIKELERRLAAVLTQAFDDCDTIEGKFKLLDSFEGLLNRPIIQDELEKKQITLLELYKVDLKKVQQIFLEGKALVDAQDQKSPVYKNLPPISGALNWTRGLYERVNLPMERLLLLGPSIQQREEFKDVQKLHASILKALREYQASKTTSWAEEVEQNSDAKLAMYLLTRDQDELLRVNFDPDLVRTLREVKYLLLLSLEVPQTASRIYDKVEVYRRQTGNLDLIVGMYNGILQTLIPVEFPLLQDRIDRINQNVQPGIVDLCWKSEGIDPFIKGSMTVVTQVNQLVKKMKENVRKMQDHMIKWADKPLVERKNKPMPPEDFEQQHKSVVLSRHQQIKDNGRDIHRLLKDSQEHIRPPKGSQEWKSYVDYVNSLIVEGMATAIISSLKYLSSLIDPNQHKKAEMPMAPMFDVKVSLYDNQVVFEPPICSTEKGNGVKDIINSVIGDFFFICTLMNRLDTNNGDYLVEIRDHFDVLQKLDEISQHLDFVENQTHVFIDQYMKYSFLWKEDLNQTFQAFLDYEPEVAEKKEGEEEDAPENEEQLEWMQQKILKGVVTKRPPLQMFNDRITEYKNIQAKIAQFKTPTDIAWLRVNSLPLKTALSRLVTQWIDKWTLFLFNNLTLQLNNILSFIQEVDQGIKVLPEAADSDKEKELLMKVMTHLRDMKTIKEPTFAEIEPMKEAVNLLKKHGVPMEEDLIVKIENSKTSLQDTGERALEAKEKILPLQTYETTNIKVDLKNFANKVEAFRLQFTKNCPFHITQSSPEVIDKAYDTISLYYEKLSSIEEQARQYRNLQTLFELQRSDYRQLKDCRNQLNNLKQMWDLISLIEYLFKSWKMTLWDKIDTEFLLMQIKDIQQKQTHPNQNKEIKHWKGFLSLQERVKNMNTIMPLISDLHSKYMEKRHWRNLMQITQRDINYDSPNFCLDDLIQLQLYRYAEDVSEIVETAQKESKIEINLMKIENNWENESLQFVDYKDTKLLGNLDDMIEVLEQNSMDLMGMLAQRHVEFFKERVLKWQKILRTVDSVIEIWLKVQKNWKRLETIFLASQDIRAQLPQDTKRFEALDIDFKDVMRDASESPSVVEACLAEGREQLLQSLFDGIELCEKSLNDYLEQKKKAFPRFYFISNQALLDILSNGNNPEKVSEYLSDCFDGMKSLNFIEKEPRPYKSAKGMYSKEGEYVSFHETFTAMGAVQNWLTDLEKMMRMTLRQILEVAKGTADNWEIEKPRQEWLDDYCAQLALVSTQIIWTEQVFRAFDELQGGGQGAMKDYLKISIDRINALIRRVRGKLTGEMRIKIITIITIDVHARDVVDNFVTNKVTDSGSFAWQRQLKFYWRHENQKTEEGVKHCFIKIADWNTKYTYEYIGNCGRLVITPLTDRCYITLTQALNLTMGGAPAGPAGTGKTETTKDLGRALGLQVVVFNCSEQMNYQSMAQIFMGLSQTGNWGCFDEFNRIRIEVLSVVSTQVKTCLDALKEFKLNPTKSKFIFLDDQISLVPTQGFFITMNPGYAGRTQLPENLKALFRSCAMVVPDIVLICENMLMSEGFEAARELSRKFMTLYDLSKQLLSKQKHYDWGLRAVKSVLRQAGMLRRADPDIEEYPLLMRALRDFNLPKIVYEDRQIFLDLIRDLFPNMECEPKQDPDLRAALEKNIKLAKLQVEEGFILKCIQLQEILQVRHSMFIIGNAGTGKTTVWKMLAQTITSMGSETYFEPINPKAVTSNELFGCLSKTKQWKDGVLSTVMRDMSKNQGAYKPTMINKWIILDGDVDPEWIESLNTVMDDNKVLTLVSSERIPLSNAMRLILQVSNLKNATPATVSRGGVLFINDNDVGWKPFTESWLQKFKQNDENARSVFYLAFTQYLNESNMDEIHSKESICPMVDMAYIHSLCMIIDALYLNLEQSKESHEYMKGLRQGGKDDEIKQIYEAIFIFAMMWSVGGALTQDKISFSGFVKSIAKVKFPDQGQVYDYYFNPMTLQWVDWNQDVKAYEPQTDTLFQNIVVPTVDTTRQRFLLDLHIKHRKPVLYVGAAGTGKTTIIKDFFSSLDPEHLLNATINFSNYTDSKAVQLFMDSNLDKRSGRTFGPPPNKQLIFFMDDLNMPEVDVYGTQTPICLIRQLLDYWTMFDRDHLQEKKKIVDVQFMGCMNPKAGSFNIDTRLQRHYTVMSCLTAERAILDQIYRQILEAHLRTFDPTIASLAPKFIQATIELFRSIADSPQFMPSARKFHYQFNMRDVSKIIQGIMLSKNSLYRAAPMKMYRLWAHEAERVFEDRMRFEEDFEKFQQFMRNSAKQFDGNADEIFEKPNIFTSFLSECQGNEKAYLPVKQVSALKKVLEDKLEEYNESNAEMNLVLFQQAIEHVARIARIVDLPAGNALLVGVGGSGKQSLSRLASFLLSYDVFSIVVSTNYGINDLKADLQTLYTKAGCQGLPQLFMLTDSQIQDEKFLVYINDMLSAGFISDLFAKDEMDTNLGKIRNEAKSAGIPDAPDALTEFFIDKSRKNIHVALCFSPVGQAFRVRARKFPGLINCTSINWFHQWPRDALISVAGRFLEDIELPTEEAQEQISIHMAEVHLSIGEANKRYLMLERRYNYTTPKSYLELIEFYKKLLGEKRNKVNDNISRLETGLLTLKQTKEKVEGLQEQLKIKQVDVEKQREQTNALIEVVQKNNAIAEEEQQIALVEEQKTEELAKEANALKQSADKELEEAVPMMQRAKQAVNCLNKNSIVELKTMTKPPQECAEVAKAVMMLKGQKRQLGWQNAQRMMNNPQRFLEELAGYNAENIEDWILEGVRPLIAMDFFNFEVMKSKSVAAAYLCNWVVSLVKYNEIYKKVKPLMDESQRAQEQVEKAKIALAEVQARVASVKEKVEGLRKKLEEAESTKKRVEDEAGTLQTKLELAQRLVNGLAGENKRWGENVQILKEQQLTIVGDALLSSAFVSYIGAFSSKLRSQLWQEQWIVDIQQRKIPNTEGVDPLFVLATNADMAGWKNDGLPEDRVSLENASIITNCSRWPLIIDPQQQGSKWIRGKQGDELIAIQLSQKQWIKKVEQAITNGQCLFIESVGQEIDAVLDPVLSRAIVKKSRTLQVIRLGSEDIEYNKNFKLYLQTKLSNPHYRPETAAQCTLINFIVTQGGLEEQLLALVVNVEKPELQANKQQLVRKLNQFQVILAKLENDLLNNLSSADPATILTNIELIEGLENTKLTATQISEQAAEARETEVKINQLREVYRAVAIEGAMLYFLLIQLCIVDHMYQYSLQSFINFFFKAIDKTQQFQEEQPRVKALQQMIRETIYQWVSRGLFVRHKQIFLTQITFRLMQKGALAKVVYDIKLIDFLVKCPMKPDPPNPLKEWLPDQSWFSMQKLIELEGFENFAVNVERDAPQRFRDWYNELAPENVKLPLDWKKLETMPVEKLLVLRCMRPDRITSAMDNFIRDTMPNGEKYVDMDSTSSFAQILNSSLQDSSPSTPIFFILSPGADPVKDVELMGKKNGFEPNKNLWNVALGQGQDVVAMQKLETAHKEGHWVMLQNIHLMPKWLLELEKKLDEFGLQGSNPAFRLFLSAEPSPGIPIGILERSIKLTNEPPSGLKANMNRAFTYFTPDQFQERDSKIKTILFGLCYFHSVMIERRKFGPKGWNMYYPFNMGDLRDSSLVLNNYMETSAGAGKIPWDDLRYIFGEIMYGGHIVDDWDRRLCNSYLINLMNDQLLDEAELFPYVDGKGISFRCPPVIPYSKYLEHIETLPGETPVAFGMHPNAEIGFRTDQCLTLFRTLQDLQPRDEGGDGQEGGGGKTEKVSEFMTRVYEDYQLDQNKLQIEDIVGKIPDEERGPFQNVFLQECEYMNQLIFEIINSLQLLQLAFNGELTMTQQMEKLMDSIYLNRVPETWAKLAFPSTRPLGSWMDNLSHRLMQLNQWKEEPTTIPKITFLNRLFNPQSFLTAIKQVNSRKTGTELNKLYIQTDITKRAYMEITQPPREGAYCFGFHVEGARWDVASGQLQESLPKKPFSVVPVVCCKAAPVLPEGKEEKGMYQCPVYKTETRGATYVFTAQLRTKLSPQKWILAGVAVILDVEGVGDYVPGKE